MLLKGKRPADIPVEQPARFKLTINQKTATSLGLVLPTTVLLRADEVVK
jgi:putative ABC transport system substrate-binding protein